MSETRKLVAYFSRAGQNYVGGSIVDLPVGNSRVAAEAIAEKVGADLFEIETVDAYPADYTECTEVAAAEKRAGVRPELAADVDTDPYDVIYLCYPNWWGTCPMAVLALLEGHDLSGKIVRPLCTNEGSGMGSSERDIRAAAPGATVGEGLAVAGGAVVRSRDVIQRWAEE
jgi:flavodoxin